MLIDTHAHLDFPEFDQDRSQLFSAMQKADISSAIIPAVEVKHWSRVIDVAHQYQCLYALGVHPWFTQGSPDDDKQTLIRAIEKNKQDGRLKAIGEIGLDTKIDTDLSQQSAYFEMQMQLAYEYQLPVIIHSVRAHHAMMQILPKYTGVKGVIHGFSGSLDVAKWYYQQGYLLGIGGLIANPQAKKLRQVVANLPLDAFVLETDSPSMPLLPKTRNTPLSLLTIAQELSEQCNQSVISVKQQIVINTLQLFDL